MENYGKIDAKTGIHTRLLDFEKALNICIDRAIQESVDFFLFAGDAYKTHNPSQKTFSMPRRVLHAVSDRVGFPLPRAQVLRKVYVLTSSLC